MLNDYHINVDAIRYVLDFLKVSPALLEEHQDLLRIKDQLEQQLGLHESGRALDLNYESWWRLLEDIARATDNPSIGLEIGASIRVKDCGLIGYLFKTSQNIYSAFKAYQRFEQLLYSGSQVDIALQQDCIWLSWNPENGLSSLQSDCLLLSALVGVIKEISEDPALNPAHIHFTQSLSQAHQQVFENYFHCPVRAEHPQLEIAFDLRSLSKDLPNWDQNLHELLSNQASSALEQLPQDEPFIIRVKKQLTQMLQNGRSSAPEIAQHLGISERSLHRKLKVSGYVYRDVLKSLRMQLSQQYLADKRISLSEVALMLGYSEQSAFNRACKLWFHQTPRQLRDSMSDD